MFSLHFWELKVEARRIGISEYLNHQSNLHAHLTYSCIKIVTRNYCIPNK